MKDLGGSLSKLASSKRTEQTEDEMVGWHHRLNGHESEKTLGDGEGLRGGLVCSSSWCCRVGPDLEINNHKAREQSRCGESKCVMVKW